MRHVMLAIARPERQGNTLDPDCVVAAGRAGKDIRQRLVALWIVRNQPSAGPPEYFGFLQLPMACSIGVHDATCRVYKKQTCADAIKRVSESCRFGLF